MSSREIVFSAAGNAGGPATYVEDVFSTYLYQGNGSTQTISNGIDLAGKGGMVWCKNRTQGSTDNILTATPGKALKSNLTNAEQTTTRIASFNSTGFFINNSSTDINDINNNYVSWTFRKQPKFFDVVTYTGNGTAGRTVAHNLGSVPGMIIIKSTNSTYGWFVYHRSIGNTKYLLLNTTDAEGTASSVWNNTSPTSTEFTLGDAANINASGTNFVAYLFAHNAGGFGAAGTDNVISCGSFTGTTNMTVELGYEPQFILLKRATNYAGDWYVMDNMRGMSVASPNAAYLSPNLSDAESTGLVIYPTATGFFNNSATSETWIYMAIRRPMKVPTDATTVFKPITSADAQGTQQTTGFVVDTQWNAYRTYTYSSNTTFVDRLRGVSSTSTSSGLSLISSSSNAETTANNVTQYWDNTGFQIPEYYGSSSSMYLNFSRRPGFYDVVCYSGDDVSGRTIAHNLGVAPELMIVKMRNQAASWRVYAAPLTATSYLGLNQTAEAAVSSAFWNDTEPTSSVFTLGNSANVNGSTYTYIAYLFASCPGVSKVGSYTGTASAQTIDCGFTGGARFVMIKRTDTSGYGWYIWDTSRGMVAGTDPSFLLNTTASEVNANSVYTIATGFRIVSLANGINASGGSYIYLAIA